MGATRTFRVFVSSTFSDLKEERNALQASVFPRLRRLCAEHGARFQAVDLRWGVREEAALDHRTMQICLDEIARSRRTSPRPNFVVLIGDRYGWRPIPAEIPASEYEALLPFVTDAGARALLERWYRQDDNSVPPRYVLLPRRPDGDPGAEAAQWAQTEEALRTVFHEAVSRAAVGDLDGVKYQGSATEQEIIAGAFSVPDAADHVFCFFRAIEGMPGDHRAAEYRDIDADGRVDGRAAERLSTLKAGLREVLPRNCRQYQARWVGPGISTDHLAALCADVYDALSRVILAELADLEEVPAIDREIAEHAAFGDGRARDFVGRTAVLAEIDAYLASADDRPFAIVGASGSGKSALLGRAIERARLSHAGAEVVCRFIGVTPASADARSLLESVCRQVLRAYGAADVAIPSDYRELARQWPQLLASASRGRPLILCFDALDQLSDADAGRSLSWLPVQLPPGIRVVVSAMTGECERALAAKLPPSHLRTLEPMPASEGAQLLDLWLQGAGRALTDLQRQGVLDRFVESDGSPLYLKLAFEEARRWRSWDGAGRLRPGVGGIIQDLLERLSRDHGAMIVARGLAYLAAARHGLSEDELIDILSSDTEVFADFIARAHHTPPEPRLPVVVWSRLYFDIEPYLSERAADNAILMTFYHRQLREGVEAAYLRDGGHERHALLARYFSAQPLVDERTRVPNLRKLSELPYQQTNAEQWPELYATLTDFDFLEAKCTHVGVIQEGSGASAKTTYGGVYELQEDYRYALDRFPER